MYDVVVKKFTFAVSSRDELLVVLLRQQTEAPSVEPGTDSEEGTMEARGRNA